ncbi:hypothetical protein C7E12_21445, partial [Stenotrophomonas maltophilia]
CIRCHRPMDPAVGQVIQSVINKGYADFTGRVAALDKIGVHTDGVRHHPFRRCIRCHRPMDPAVGQVIQSVINKGYADFTGRVA